jgi:hypothetical protein
MTSQSDFYYLPFWVLLEYIGDTPPDPFIKVFLIEEYQRTAQSPDGPVEYEACTIAIHEPDSKLLANDVPIRYLISNDDIVEWGDKLGRWFTEGARKIAKGDAEP